jgi:hypothetical protein
MNSSDVNLHMKAYSYVQNLILWSKGQRQGADRKSPDQLAVFTSKEYQNELKQKLGFAITCIECVYQFIPLYERNALTGDLQKPRYVLGLRDDFANEMELLLNLANFSKAERERVSSDIFAASERGWQTYSQSNR